MRLSSRTWSLVSLACLAAGAFFLYLDRRQAARNRPPQPAATEPARASRHAAASYALLSAVPGGPALGTGPARGANPDPLPSSERADEYRLTNTDRPLKELLRSDSALLLENAFLDTAVAARPRIPAHLRSSGDPGAYVVQFRGSLDRVAYDQLKAAGAEFVAYVPNNAALVRSSAETAARLAAAGNVRTVLPYEPYYRIARRLLPLAVNGQSLPDGQLLRVLAFPGRGTTVRSDLSAAGYETLGEEPTPFGPMFTLRAAADALPVLAQVADVQRIEPAQRRVLLNDLSRDRVNVDTNVTDTNAVTSVAYLGLTGQGILVNVNDTGVDAGHVALAGRVTTTDTNAFTLTDTNGHGTHVAATIAGSGVGSSSVTNAQGSVTNASFAGMAPQADLFVLPVDEESGLGPLISDAHLQVAAATEYYTRRGGTNLLLSNNSWNYLFSADYDLPAASYDAAVRDALPEVPGSQPVLFVFSAGNSGFGADDGTSGAYDSIGSPGTAKNVITVGALELPRFLTNAYFITNKIDEGTTNETEVVTTNTPFLELTDSRNEVAAYSSRGNVGVGREGTYGRFKPDVVAPGSFLISARSSGWEVPWRPWQYDTNVFVTLSNLNETLGSEREYRYETGTSMSAGVVSGTLALIQEFFEKRLSRGLSPALLKALLIHGARPVNTIYDLQVQKTLNHQGWGVVNLTNSLPEALTTGALASNTTVRVLADPSTNVLATGQSQTWTLRLTEASEARFTPLRLTLVWTDPPGNPAVAVKLVNDLNLVVTNYDDTGTNIYVGNNIPSLSEFTAATAVGEAPPFDVVNNVESIILAPPLRTNLTIGVTASRVNVNALPDNYTDVVQDYALVLTAGDGLVTNPIERLEWLGGRQQASPLLVVTNGVVEFRRRAGASFQPLNWYDIAPNGASNQWQFFVFTNTFFTNQNVSGLTNGSNVLFATFTPPNLARPRGFQADIDLYVATNIGLLTLDPVAVSGAWKSLSRTGTEAIALTNATTNMIFYIGVKSEDQQAAQFDLLIQSSDDPFSTTDEHGNLVLPARGLPLALPDGSPSAPGGVRAYPYAAVRPRNVLRAFVEMNIAHDAIGDLVGQVGHVDQAVALLNHNSFGGVTNTIFPLFYDDLGTGQFPGSRFTDGPGTLLNFIGDSTEGVWLLSVTDDTYTRTGYLNHAAVRLYPRPDDPLTISGYVLPGAWFYDFVDLPLDATEFILRVTYENPNLGLDIYLRREALPDATNYDKKARMLQDDEMRLSRFDSPPLNPGRYFVGIYNPNAVGIDFTLVYQILRDPNAINQAGLKSGDTPRVLPDDAVTQSTVFFNDARPVVDLQVGVRVDHSRASDLVFHLISPGGNRVLLAENRGGLSPLGYGATLSKTNVASVSSSGGPEEDRQTINAQGNEGRLIIDYDFYVVPDFLRVYYDGVRLLDTGMTNRAGSLVVDFGPGIDTNVVVVVNEGGSAQSSTFWEYNARIITVRELYTVFTERTNLTTQPIKFAEPPFTNSLSLIDSTNRMLLADGFESYPTGRYTNGAALAGWTVGPGDVVIHGAGNALGAAAFEGSQFAEFEVGATPAALSTEFATVVNVDYVTRFRVRRNPLGPPGSPQTLGLYLDGALVRQVLAPGTNWGVASFAWRANSSVSRLELRATTPTGPLVDMIEMLEVVAGGAAHFLPEEDMHAVMKGTLAYGDWTLEVWDNRAGPTTVPGEVPLLSAWTLNVVLANTNPPAAQLLPCVPDGLTYSLFTNGCVPIPQVVEGDEIKYFAVEAPRSATAVTNLLTSLPAVFGSSGDLVLLFNPLGLPNGARPGDVVVNTPSGTGEVLALGTNAATPPAFRPGQRYYLGVANANPGENNAFLLSATFDRVDGYLVAAPALTNGVVVTNTIGVTNGLQFYQFTVSTNATHVTFEAFPTSGDVDLFVRQARPGGDPLPRPAPASHDYASQNVGATAPEEIVVTRPSQPVGLAPGVWYVGIENRTTNAATYQVVAREYTDLVTLVRGVPYTNSIPVTNGLQYFQFVVADDATRAEFRLQATGGDAGLYVRQLQSGPLPLPRPVAGQFDYATNVVAPDTRFIEVLPDSFPVPLWPGVWFASVTNRSGTPTAYVLTANQTTPIVTEVLVDLVDGVPLPYTLLSTDLVPTHFRFSVPADAAGVLFEVYDLTSDATLLVQRGARPVVGASWATNDGTPALGAQIVVRSNAVTGSLGDLWYLKVERPPGIDLAFTIRAALPVGGILPSGAPMNVTFAPASPPGSGWVITWETIDGENYVLERSADLTTWTVVTTLTASGRSATFTDPLAGAAPILFYRIRQVP